ncbi:MAG: hypothetical protein A2Z72_03340 [Omnitrophica bacterium RBG_13_46_9]|nr:MAG: hypothetical protein A2Z72_03340 [Omnitrophica bacterium RBG_13_46_9]
MEMLLSFMPWFLFWVLLSMRKPEPAALAGFFVTFIVIIVEKFKGRSIKILQAGTLFFFLALAALALFTELEWFGHWVNLLSNLALTMIVFISIVIGKPFTLQYAKEETPEKYWSSPEFIQINYMISCVWFLAFLVNLTPSVIRALGVKIPVSSSWAASLISFAAAAKFTAWYPRPRKKTGV